MKTLFVYIVKCKDGSYYVGLTNNIERRLWEHNNEISPTSYTFTRRPVDLVFLEEFEDYRAAFEFESRIKKWTRAKKEALTQRNWNKIKRLSICTNETNHHNQPRKPFDSAQGDSQSQ